MTTNYLSSFLTIIWRTPWRSLSIFLAVGVITWTALVFFLLEKNALSALEYYQYSPLDDRRFSLIEDTDIFSLFARGAHGIDDETLHDISRDAHIERSLSLTLVEIPVLVKFGMFQFSLESDMPVFAISDSALTGARVPIGISQVLLDFYNTQFAGSSPYFPIFEKDMILGQSLTLHFGQSKLFSVSSSGSTPLIGKITAIDNNFPGFGIMVPESLVREKLSEIGVTLDKPYKIIGYMRSLEDEASIRETYGEKYILTFDKDSIEKLREKANIMRMILAGIGGGLFLILFLIFAFLIAGHARERVDIYRLFQVLGITGFRARSILLIEPLFLICLGILIGAGAFLVGELLSYQRLTQILLQKGIDFPLLTLSLGSIWMISGALFLIMGGLVWSIDRVMTRSEYI